MTQRIASEDYTPPTRSWEIKPIEEALASTRNSHVAQQKSAGGGGEMAGLQ